MEKIHVLALSLNWFLLYTQKFVTYLKSESVCTKKENFDANYWFCNLVLQTVAINFMRKMLEFNFLVIFL